MQERFENFHVKSGGHSDGVSGGIFMCNVYQNVL